VLTWDVGVAVVKACLFWLVGGVFLFNSNVFSDGGAAYNQNMRMNGGFNANMNMQNMNGGFNPNMNMQNMNGGFNPNMNMQNMNGGFNPNMNMQNMNGGFNGNMNAAYPGGGAAPKNDMFQNVERGVDEPFMNPHMMRMGMQNMHDARMQKREMIAREVAAADALSKTRKTVQELWVAPPEVVEARLQKLKEAADRLAATSVALKSMNEGQLDNGPYAMMGGPMGMPGMMGPGVMGPGVVAQPGGPMMGMGYGPYGAHPGMMRGLTRDIQYDVHKDAVGPGVTARLREEASKCTAALAKSDVLLLEENLATRKKLIDLVSKFSNHGLDSPKRGRRLRRMAAAKDTNRKEENQRQILANFVDKYRLIIRRYYEKSETSYREVLIAFKGALLQELAEEVKDVKNLLDSFARDLGKGSNALSRGVSGLRSRFAHMTPGEALKMHMREVRALREVLEEHPELRDVEDAYRADQGQILQSVEEIDGRSEFATILLRDKYTSKGFMLKTAEDAEELLKNLPVLLDMEGIQEDVLDRAMDAIVKIKGLQEGVDFSTYVSSHDQLAQHRLQNALAADVDSGSFVLATDRRREPDASEEGVVSRAKRFLGRKSSRRGGRINKEKHENMRTTHNVLRLALTQERGLVHDDEEAVSWDDVANRFQGILTSEQKNNLVEAASKVVEKWQAMREDGAETHYAWADFDACLLAKAVGWNDGAEIVRQAAMEHFNRRRPQLVKNFEKGSFKVRFSVRQECHRFSALGIIQALAVCGE